MERDFNRGWTFRKENGEGRTVVLPHDAMLEEQRTAYCHNGAHTGYFPGGKYEYHKTLSLTEDEARGTVALRFGGVYRHAVVTCNGEEVLRQHYGYTPFVADLSGRVRAGDNEILVTVDNSLEPNSRWYTGSGIIRPVRLTLCAAKPIREVRIETRSLSPAVIAVEAQAEQAEVTIYDGDKPVASGPLGELSIPNAKLWSTDQPHLYTCVLRTADDEVRVPFGIRTVEVSADKGLRINGETVKLRGGCVHHDNGILGACSFADAERRRVRILKDCGYNAIRCAHNPCSDELLAACDELGLYVLDEAYDGWYTPKTHHDSSRDFEAEYREVLTSMVTRDRNHPSVILYSIGNEVTEVGEERGVRLAEEMQDLIHTLDDTRPVTCGVNAMLTVWGRMGLGVYKDKAPYERSPLPQSDIKPPKSGSALFNALMVRLGKLMDGQTKSKKADDALAGVSQVLDVLGLNYGFLRYEKELAQHPGRILLGTENRIDSLPMIWKQVLSHSAILGDFCWTAMDYLGEAGIGHWNYPSEQGLPLLAGCGAIDLIGIPDAMNGFQRIIWGLETNPWLGVCPMDHAGEKPLKKTWRFTNAVPNWTWPEHEGKTAQVEVFSAAPAVELRLNGTRIGRKKPRDYLARFRLPYESGTLEAIALDSKGEVTGRTALQTGSRPTLRVTADRPALRANGQDLAHLMIELKDDRGILSPISGVPVTVGCDGSGTLQGFGSAACVTDESFTDNGHTTFQGRCLAVIRSGSESGEIRVAVKTKDYGEAVVRLNVQ